MISISGSLKTDKHEWLFKDISLSLADSGWTCLLGPSGVGKTTVLRLLAGLETHGDFVGKITPEKPCSLECAYMAQQDLLMPWLDVTENASLGARLRNEKPDTERVRAIIERVGLTDHAHKMPPELSGGMRQRAALARTLMEDRSLVLLDEPFSALDAKTRAEMQELAHELLSGRTVLLVTHDPGEAARLGDRIYIMNGQGAEEMAAKGERGIAAPDAVETLNRQSKLLTHLRGQVA